MGGQLLSAGLFSMGVVMAALPGAIRLLQRLGAGKQVRAEGPARHAVKAGTPTMGGAVVALAVVASTLAWAPHLDTVAPMCGVLLGFALLGSVDDLQALRFRRAMGLRAREKLLGQVALALLAAAWVAARLPEAGRWVLPFSRSAWVPVAPVAVAVSTFVMVASANAVNLTDGLDGLAAGSMTAAALAYTAIAWALGNPDVAVFAAAVAGACLGFIWYNGYPAQVFMGDTGSLALGSALALFALTTGTALVLPVVGGMFVLETLSVMAQVAYFKLTGGRRLFRMSPLHHHLELSGWAEPQVVVRLWLGAAVFAALGLWAVVGFRG